MDGSQPLTNPKHERFALLVAYGEVSAAEAYRREYPDAAPKSVEACSSRLADKVKLRIGWLKAEVERKARETANGVVLSMLEKRTICASIARIGEKDADRLKAIQVDNDLAVDGAAANKELVVVVKIGGADDGNS